jgi:hypothetical protein
MVTVAVFRADRKQAEERLQRENVALREEIDKASMFPRPFQAALDQAQGQLAQAKPQLATAEAVQGRTQLDVEKYTPLAKV